MTKKLSRILIVLAIMVAISMVFVACNKPDETVTVKSFTLDGVPTTDIEVEDFSISGISLAVTLSDGKTSTVQLSWDMISEADKALLRTAGTHTVTVTYQGVTASMTVNIIDKDDGGGEEPPIVDPVKGVVNFNTNGGSVISQVTVEIGSTVNAPTAPTKDYKNFDGWYEEKTFITKAVFPYTVSKNSTTFYAKWKDNYVTIEYKLNANDVYTTKTCVQGESLPSVTNPQSTGYKFGGWCIDAAATTLVGTKNFTQNATVYAKWIPIEYNMVFNLGSGYIPDTFTLYADNTSAPQRYSFELAKATGAYVFLNGKYVLYNKNDTEHKDLDRYTPEKSESGEFIKNRLGAYVPYRYDADFGTAVADGYYAKINNKYVVFDITNPAHQSAERFNITVTPNVNGLYCLVSGSSKGSYAVTYPFNSNTSPCTTPTKDGFTFEGWFDSDGVAYVFGKKTADYEYVYAKWSISDDEAFYSYSTDIDGTIVITGASDKVVGARTAESLIIPASIGGKTVKGIADGAFANYNVLNSLTIAEGIKFVGAGAFADSPLGGTVIIPDSLKDIGYRAFGDGVIFETVSGFRLKGIRMGDSYEYIVIKYEGVSTVTFPADKVIIEIGAGAFEGVEISSITIPASVKKIGAYAFRNSNIINRAAFAFASGSKVQDIHKTAFDNTVFVTTPASKSLIFGNLFYKYFGTAATITIPANVEYLADDLFAQAGTGAWFVFEDEANIKKIGKNVFSNAQIKNRLGNQEWFVLNGILVKYVGNGGFITVPTDKGIKSINIKAFEGADSTYLKSITFTSNLGSGGDALVIDANAFSGLRNLKLVFADTGAVVPVISAETFCSVADTTYSVLPGLKLLFVDQSHFLADNTWKLYSNIFEEYGVSSVRFASNAITTSYYKGEALDINANKVSIITNDGNTHAFDYAIMTSDFDSARALPDYTKIEMQLYVNVADTWEKYSAATHGAIADIEPAKLKREAVLYVYINTAGEGEADNYQYVKYDKANEAHKDLPTYYKATAFGGEGFPPNSLKNFYYLSKDEQLFVNVNTANQGEVANYEWIAYDATKHFSEDVCMVPYKTATLTFKLYADSKVTYKAALKYYVKPIGVVAEKPAETAKKEYTYLENYSDAGTLLVTYNFGTYFGEDITSVFEIPINKCTYEGFDTSVIDIGTNGLPVAKTVKLTGSGYTYSFDYTVSPVKLADTDPITVDDRIEGLSNALKDYYVEGESLKLASSFITRNFANGTKDYVKLSDCKSVTGFDTSAVGDQKNLVITYSYYEYETNKWVKKDGAYTWKYDVDYDVSSTTFEFQVKEGETFATLTNCRYFDLRTPEQIAKGLQIPRKYEIDGKRYVVEAIAKGAFNTRGANKITIPSTIRIIEDGAFEGSTFVNVVIDPNSALTEIPAGAFKNAKELKSVTYGSSITKIGSYAFENTAITSYAPANFGGITEIGPYAFKDCSKLVSVDFTDVTSIRSYAFYNCAALTTINFDDVSEIGSYAFTKTGVTSLVLPNTITKISSAMFKESALTDITISGAITSIGDRAFESCANLETVTVSNESVLTYLGDNAFANCVKLATVTEFTQLNTIGAEAYKNTLIPKIYIGSKVAAIGANPFSGCYSATQIEVVSTFNDTFTLPDNLFAYCSGVTSADITSITQVGVSTFEGCSSLQTITNSTTFSKIGANAFKNCSALTNIGLFSSVTDIGANAFENAGQLGNIDLSALTSLGKEAFKNCKLTGITLGESLTIISESAFEGSALTTVSIPKTVKEISTAAFRYCKDLASVSIAGDNALTVIGAQAFKGDIKLATLTIGVGQKANKNYKILLTIGESAFEDCSQLENLYFPGSVSEIGNNAFRNCSIKKISFGVVTDTVYVHNADKSAYIQKTAYVLEDKDMTAPALTKIGEGAFGDSTYLSQILLGCKTMPTLGTNAFAAVADINLVIVDSDAVYDLAFKWLSTGSESRVTRGILDYTATTPVYWWTEPTT